MASYTCNWVGPNASQQKQAEQGGGNPPELCGAGSVACAMCTPAKLISLAMHAPQPHIASQKCKQVACGLLQAGVAIALAPDGGGSITMSELSFAVDEDVVGSVAEGATMVSDYQRQSRPKTCWDVGFR